MAEDLGQAQLTLTVNLDRFREDLRRARSLVDSELRGAGTGTTTGARRGQRSTGGGTRATSAASAEAKAEKDLEVLKEKRFRLARRIDSLEERGVNTTRLRTQLGRLTTAYADREFTTARNISRELARQATLAEQKERRSRRAAQAAKAEAAAATSSPRGLGRVNLDGSLREVGSPRFVTRGARQGGASESVDAPTDAQKRRYRLDQQIRSLEAAGVNSAKLRTQLGEATTAQARRQFGSFNQIADALDFTLRKERDRLKVSRDQSRELERQATGGRRIGRLNASPVRGGIAFPGSPGANAAAQAEGLRIGRLNSSPVRGGRAFPDSPAANEAIVSRNLKVRSSWVKALDFLDDTATLIARNAKKAAEADGLRIGRLNSSSLSNAGIPGSPAAKAAQRRADEQADQERRRAFREQQAEGRRIGRLNTSPVRGGPAFPDSPAFIEAEVKRNTKIYEDFLKQQQSEGLRIGALNTSPVRGGKAFPGSPIALEAEADLQKARAKTAADTFRAAQSEQKREQKAAATRRKALNKRVGGAIGSGLIGGGFPLLFGQGAGAAAGGALGGIGGGALGGQFGFALSVVGTAVGAAFDAALEKGKLLADGLNDPIGQFDKLRDAALFSTKGIEKTVGALIAAGRTEEAKILAEDDLNRQFGGAENARAFAAATDELNRAWAQTSIALADFVAGPLADFLSGLAIGIGGGAERRRAEAENKEARGIIDGDPAKRQQFLDLAKQRGVSLDQNLNVSSSDLGKRVALVREFLDLNGRIPAEQREQQERDAKLAAASERRLRIERNTLDLIKAQTAGNRTAELDEKEALVKDNRDAALNSLGRGATQVERDAINVKATEELTKLDAERLKLQRDLNQALTEEATRREGIVRQIKVAEAGREAALARADFGASPGSSALGARAGAAEGSAFVLQNQEQVRAAIDAQRQLQTQLQFEVDPGKQAELVSKIQTAAEQTRLAYVQAGTALAEKAGQAAASLQGARDSLRSTLEGNSKLIPREQRKALDEQAKADIERGRRTGVLRENLRTPGGRARRFEVAQFVRQVERERAQIAGQLALIEALRENTRAERQIQITVNSDGQGGFNVNQSERQAALL